MPVRRPFRRGSVAFLVSSPLIRLAITPPDLLTLQFPQQFVVEIEWEESYGIHGLEGPSDIRVDFDSDSPVLGGAHRAHQLQSAPQSVPLAPQAAVVLPHLQPEC